MAVYKTAAQVGKRQDLSSIVKDITPTDVPFTKSLGSEKAINSTFNWVDKNVAMPAKVAVAEGGTPVDSGAGMGRVQRTNYTEIFAQAVEISSTAEATEQAGSASFAERVADSIGIIQRQKETVFLGGQAGSPTDTNRLTASAQLQIDSSLIDAPGTAAAISKIKFDETLEAAFSAGADIDTVYVDPAMKRKLTSVLTFSAVTREAGQGKTVTDSVDIYQSDFGDVNIIVDRYIKTGDLLFADSSMWVEKVLVPMSSDDLSKNGLAKRKLVHTEVGLKNGNFFGSALMSNYTV